MIPFVLLRVPIIFVLDEFFKSNFDVPELASVFSIKDDYVNSTVGKIDNVEPIELYYSIVFQLFIKIVMYCIILWSMFYLISLPETHLHLAYAEIFVVCVALLSFWMNVETLMLFTEKYKNYKRYITDKIVVWDIVAIVDFLTKLPILELSLIIFRNLIVQYLLLQLFELIASRFLLLDVTGVCFLIPILFVFVPTTQKSLNLLYVFLTFLPLLKALWLNIFTTTNCLINLAYKYLLCTIRQNGIFFTIRQEWYSMELPSVLRLFWFLRLIFQYLYLLPYTRTASETIKLLLINGCDTIVSFSGMVFFVSSLLHCFQEFIKKVLFIDELETRNLNKIFIILFYIMAYQTGLLYLEPEERFTQLCENVFLLCSVLPIYLHNIIRPLLTYSTYFDSHSIKWRPGALLVCGFFSMFSIKMLINISLRYSFSSWLLVVSVFNCQTNIQLFSSLAIYLLYLTNCLRFDYYLTYIKMFGSIMNFFIDIFLVLAGIYIMAYESFGVVRAIIICLHIYHI